MQEWRVFGHALRLPKKVAKDSVLNQLFIRANQDRTPIGIDYFKFENLEKLATAPTAMSTEKGHKDGQMQLKEFVVGVVRLACAAFPTTPAIAEALRRLLDEHIRCASCALNWLRRSAYMSWSVSDDMVPVLAGLTR